jgi:PhzF family phenazine biosynthesis protein
LCVFEDARGLDDATMQALALQFNLSETTFVFPSRGATAHVRIFTPTFEMPFAGHPTLGTAHVVRATREAGNAVTLEMKAGIIPVEAQGDVWTLAANPPKHRKPQQSRAELAEMLGLDAVDLLDPPLWVNTGSDQLMIPLASLDAVRRAAPRQDVMLRTASTENRAMAYVFARDGERVLARFFFLQHGALVEDPGTGSACANLGGWLIATGVGLPRHFVVYQGEAVNRRCKLGLEITSDAQIRVSGRVIALARGSLTL